MIELLHPTTREERELRLKLGLLTGQSVALGTTLSLLIIVGNALFLPLFGAQALPYVYITVAILGSLVSYGSTQLQKRWSLPPVAISITSAIALFVALAWISLVTSTSRWTPFALLVLFPLFIQLGFVFLGGQAGRLLDVRQIKRLFPQIVAGFVIGFMVGGLAMPTLVRLLGSTENVLLAVFAITLNFLAFMAATALRFKEAFRQVAGGIERQPSRSLSQLLSRRFVLLIFLYQVLVAVVNQLADFILLAQAGARYAESESLAQFFSTFTVVLNGLDLLVLLVIASYFLGRFGLRAGLLANPVTGLLLFVAMIIAAAWAGPSSGLFFYLVASARVANIVFNDGTSRTSLNAAYQALPAGERALVQTAAEGIGAPLALGAVGALLLVYNAISGLTIVHVVALTLFFTILWIVVSHLLYGEYAGSLLQSLKRRALGEADLFLEDSTSMEVLDRLLQSGQFRETLLALDALELSGHASLDDRLLQLLESDDPSLQEEVMARLARRQVEAARPGLVRLIRETRADSILSAALRAFCALPDTDTVETVAPYLEHESMEVRRAAMAGLLRYGGIPGVLAAGNQVQTLQSSAAAADRILSAEVIGDVGAANFYQPLESLLEDDDTDVLRAALVAAGQVRHPRLLPRILGYLNDPQLRSAAITALVAYGDLVLPFLETALSGKSDLGPAGVQRLVRMSARSAGDAVVAVLKRHMDHQDGHIRHAVLAGLNLRHYRSPASENETMRRLLRAEVDLAAHISIARLDLGDDEAVAPMQRVLQDEMTMIRRRSLLLLSFHYDPQAILGAGERLRIGDRAARALAMESLDVTLSTEDKSLLFPLLDPAPDWQKRAQRMAGLLDSPPLGREQRLLQIVENRAGQWASSWLRTSAIYAIGRLGLHKLAPAVANALADDAFPVRETAVWALSLLDPEAFSARLAGLTADPDPRIARLASQLGAA